METEIATAGKLSATQPHYWQTTETHLREHEGEPAYELPLGDIVTYIQGHAGDALMREAVQRVMGSHGLHTQFHLIENGESALGKCFIVAHSDAGEINAAIHADWVEAHLHHFSILLGDTQPHTRPNAADEIDCIRQHQIALLALIGLEPNMERITKEFCRNCK